MKAYRLAICEDDDAIRAQLHSLCHEILTEAAVEHSIADFPSAQQMEKLLAAESNPFDLLLLDIQMEGMTGMELAQSLRQRGDRVSIIFVTGCEDYLLEGYGVQPIHFLLKPINREELNAALRTDWQLNHKPKTAVLRIGSKTVSLPLAEIRYIESYNHSIIVHQTEGDRTYFLSLSDFEKQMPRDQFCRCHNSYLVNMDYVEEIGGRSFPCGAAPASHRPRLLQSPAKRLHSLSEPIKTSRIFAARFSYACIFLRQTSAPSAR